MKGIGDLPRMAPDAMITPTGAGDRVGAESIYDVLRDARRWVEHGTAPVRGLSAEAAAPGEAMLARIDAALSAPAPARVGVPAELLREAIDGLAALTGEATVQTQDRLRALLANASPDPQESGGASGDGRDQDDEDAREAYLQEIADGAWGDDPRTRGLARDALEQFRARAEVQTPDPTPADPDGLEVLSRAATQGEWTAPPWGTDIRAGGKTIGMMSPAGDGNGKANRAYVLALVARHRAGHLVPADPAPAGRAVSEEIASAFAGAFVTTEAGSEGYRLVAQFDSVAAMQGAADVIFGRVPPDPAQTAGAGSGDGFAFAVGQPVEKIGGDYTFAGPVVAAFRKLSGAERYVIEDDRGVLHVYAPKNLRAAPASASADAGKGGRS